jgi:predicted PurR-regulated permease PerM
MPPSPWMSTAAGGRSRRTVRVSTGTIIGLAGVLLAVLVLQNAFVAGQRVLGWAAASTATAAFVAPLVSWLGRFIPRVAAVLLTFLAIGVAAGALVFGVFDDLDREVRSLQRAAPGAAERLEERDDEIGAAMRDLQLTERVEVFLDEVDRRIGSGSEALTAGALTVPVYFVNAILTIFLLLYGPGILRGGLGLIGDDRRRERLTIVLGVALVRARRSLAAMFGQGTLFGLVVGGVAWLVDLPAPVVLGLVAGVAATIPDFGILLGILPTLAVTAGIEDGRAAVVMLAAALVLQAFEALYVRRRLDRWGVEVGPTVVWIVVLLGYVLHGPGMALFGVAYAVYGLSVLDELAAVRTAEGPEPART